MHTFKFTFKISHFKLFFFFCAATFMIYTYRICHTAQSGRCLHSYLPTFWDGTNLCHILSFMGHKELTHKQGLIKLTTVVLLFTLLFIYTVFSKWNGSSKWEIVGKYAILIPNSAFTFSFPAFNISSLIIGQKWQCWTLYNEQVGGRGAIGSCSDKLKSKHVFCLAVQCERGMQITKMTEQTNSLGVKKKLKAKFKFHSKIINAHHFEGKTCINCFLKEEPAKHCTINEQMAGARSGSWAHCLQLCCPYLCTGCPFRAIGSMNELWACWSACPQFIQTTS